MPAYTVAPEDETLDRLIRMTNETNRVAIDKTMEAILCYRSYACAAARVASIAERIVRAAHEVGMCLEPELRATYHNEATTSTKMLPPVTDNVTYLRTGTK